MQGPGDSQDEVLERYQSALPLVEVIARHVSRSMGTAVDYDDLVGSGREGLYEAARRYESNRGIPFRSYACLRVRGAILDSVRRQAHLPRRAHERFVALEAALAVSEGQLGAAHSPATARLPAGEAERKMAAHLANVATAAAFGVTARSGHDPIGGPGERLNPEEQLAEAELHQLIRQAIADMAPDEAGVIRAYYFEGKSMDAIAKQENFSKSWAWRLHAQGIARLTQRIRNSV